MRLELRITLLGCLQPRLELHEPLRGRLELRSKARHLRLQIRGALLGRRDRLRTRSGPSFVRLPPELGIAAAQSGDNSSRVTDTVHQRGSVVVALGKGRGQNKV